MEIDLRGLALHLWKSSSKHSISVQPTLTRIFFLCSSFPFFLQMPSHSPHLLAWSFRRLGLVRSTPGLLGFCIVAAARHVRSLRFASPEAFAAWVWSESPPGFHRCFFLLRFELSVASFFFVLSVLPTALLNRVHWARFAWTKSEFSRLDFFA